MEFTSGFRVHADDGNLHLFCADSGFPAAWVGARCLVHHHPFVAERTGCRGCPYGSEDLGMAQRPSRGLLAGVLLSLCFAWGLLLPELVTLHSCVLCLRGHKMLLLRKPPDRLSPSWCVCAVTASSVLRVDLSVWKDRSTASGISPCDHTWA